MAADKEKKEEKAEAEVVLTEAERLQILEGNNKLNRILLIVMLVIVGFALPITLTISLLGGSGDEEASAASAKPAPGPHLLIRIGHRPAPCIRGRGVDRSIRKQHQPTSLTGLLHRPARQAGMGGIGALRQSFHGAAVILKALVINT